MSSSEDPCGFLLVVSGASGSGKSSVCNGLAARSPERYCRSVSATTRPPRSGEADGREYHFIDPAEFAASIAGGDLLEHAEVFGQLYGTPRFNLEEAARTHRTLLLDIDVQGGSRLRDAGLPGLWVWIDPPSPEVLDRRLRNRGTNSDEDIRKRLATADQERRAALGVYDHFLVNNELETTVAEIDGLALSYAIRDQEKSQQ